MRYVIKHTQKNSKMKRRELKKNIEYICGELMAEVVVLRHSKKDVNVEDVDNILMSILRLRDDLVARLSHVEPGNTKMFFKKLKKDFREGIDSVVEAMGTLA